MTGIRGFIHGFVRVRLSGDVEACLRALTAADAVTLRVARSGGDVFCTLSLADFARLRGACRSAGCRFHIISRSGLPFLLRGIGRRPVPAAFIALLLAALYALSGIIWTVRIDGADAADAARITECLASLGIAPGTPSDAFDAETVRMSLTRLLPDYSYAAVNLRGSRAYVQVVERRETPAARYEREIKPADVVAARDGIILRVDGFKGDEVVNPGSTVAAGDILVSGEVKILSPNMQEETGRTRLVHARADVWARVWRVSEAKADCAELIKRYTGREVTTKRYFFAGHAINIWQTTGIYYAHCDRIASERAFTLPFGAETPITVVTEVCREYELVPAEADRDAVSERLRGFIIDNLLSGADRGRIVSAEYTETDGGGALSVACRSETEEQIGTERARLESN